MRVKGSDAEWTVSLAANNEELVGESKTAGALRAPVHQEASALSALADAEEELLTGEGGLDVDVD